MSRTRLAHYLRTHRKRSALSQAELAVVCGFCESAISKYELRDYPRSLRLVIAAHLVFELSPNEMFPGSSYGEVASIIASGAAKLDAQLAARPDEESFQKRKFLAELINRANANAYRV